MKPFEQARMLIFIPAMGACHELPRKFVRQMLDKPLVRYSLDLSVMLAGKSNVILLTDDEEIELIGKRSGVRTVLVNEEQVFPRKFGQGITLDLLRECEGRLSESVDYVIWLGPSSPLLRKRDVVEAVNYLARNEVDAVFSASEVPQRAWEYDRTYQPSFREVSNTRHDGILHKETGAFFIMKRSAIDASGYRGKTGRPFFLHETHSLEINSFTDWWIAEKLLQKKHILFVVHGNNEIGMGHVFRVLSLSQEFIDHEVQILCTHGSDVGYIFFRKNALPAFLQPEGESLLDCVLKHSPDVVINDILDTTKDYIAGLKQKNITVVNFEDQGEGARHADLVVNALYEKSAGSNMVVGHEYFMLRSEFLDARIQKPGKRVKNVLVTFGGADGNNLTLRALKILLPVAAEHKFGVSVITGIGYVNGKELESYLGSMPPQLRKLVNRANGTRQISEFMSEADFAITSAGRTVYELAAMKRPAIIIAANERERLHGFGRKAGMKYLGLHSSVTDSVIEKSILKLVESPVERSKISHGLERIDLTKGRQNVVDKINRIISKK